MSDHAATYLTDHMAGSTGALDLLERLKEAHAGDPLGATAARLFDEISAERKILDDLGDRVGISMSLPRKAASWVGEKLVQVKLLYDDPLSGSLSRLESLEALSLGIAGKGMLWRSLQASSRLRPELAGPDYESLAALAEDQRRRLEPHRIAAAEEALAAAKAEG